MLWPRSQKHSCEARLRLCVIWSVVPFATVFYSFWCKVNGWMWKAFIAEITSMYESPWKKDDRSVLSKLMMTDDYTHSRRTLNTINRASCTMFVCMFDSAAHGTWQCTSITHCDYGFAYARSQNTWETNCILCVCAFVSSFIPFCRKAVKQLILYVLYGKWKCSRTRIFRVPLTIDPITTVMRLRIIIGYATAMRPASNCVVHFVSSKAKRFKNSMELLVHQRLSNRFIEFSDRKWHTNELLLQNQNAELVVFTLTGRSLAPHRYSHALNEIILWR